MVPSEFSTCSQRSLFTLMWLVSEAWPPGLGSGGGSQGGGRGGGGGGGGTPPGGGTPVTPPVDIFGEFNAT